MIETREPPRAVSVAEAARLLGVSRATAYRLIQDGRLAHVSMRSLKRVPIRAIDELLAGDRAVAP